MGVKPWVSENCIPTKKPLRIFYGVDDMARISLKEQYDNKDVITQIYDLKDMSADNAEATANAQQTADTAIGQAEDAVAKAESALAQTSEFDVRINTAQSDATLALEQAEDAQTDADKGIVDVAIETNEANGTLYTKTNANVEVRKNIPLASSTQTGLMNAQTYQGLINLNTRVTALEAKKSTAYVVFTSNNPTQEEITQKFTAVVGRAPIAGDQVTDISKSLTYEYDGTTWIQTTAPVANWSNETAGIIKGTSANGAPGTLFAEEDGTGSVNGWDELNTTIANNYTTLAKAFSGYSITELADRIQVQFDAVDGATSVSEEIPAATDEKAGVLTASDWAKFTKGVIKAHTVTLALASWVGTSITVECPDVTAENVVFISPTSGSFLDYTASVIRASVQGAGTLTFICDSLPPGDVTVNVGVCN